MVLFGTLAHKIEMALIDIGFYAKAEKLNRLQHAFVKYRLHIERILDTVLGTHQPHPRFVFEVKETSAFRQLLVNIRSKENQHGVRKLTAWYFGDKCTAREWYEAVRTGNLPSKAIQAKRKAEDQEAIRKRTKTEPTSECPQCKRPTLRTRVFQAAAKGSCGGKAIMQVHQECHMCNYQYRD